MIDYYSFAQNCMVSTSLRRTQLDSAYENIISKYSIYTFLNYLATMKGYDIHLSIDTACLNHSQKSHWPTQICRHKSLLISHFQRDWTNIRHGKDAIHSEWINPISVILDATKSINDSVIHKYQILLTQFSNIFPNSQKKYHLTIQKTSQILEYAAQIHVIDTAN